MSENTINYIAVACFFAIVVLGYIRLFFKAESSGQKFIKKAKAAGNYTTARSVSSKYRQGNRESGNDTFRYDAYTVKYEYVVDGIKYYKKIRFQSPGMVGVNYPIQVTVYYNPANPKKSVCQEEAAPNRSLGCLGTLVIAVVVFFVVRMMILQLLA